MITGNIDFNYKCSFNNHVEDLEIIQFNVRVNSNGFCGESSFAQYEMDLRKMLYSLMDMFESLDGVYEMWDHEGEDFIKIESINRLGHFRVTGTVGYSYYSTQYLRFDFEIDQTVIKQIISNIEAMLQSEKTYLR